MPDTNPDLIIVHLGGTTFQLYRDSATPVSPQVQLSDPATLPVRGWEEFTLLAGWRWYHEQFIRQPGLAWRDRAREVQDAITAWGEGTFETLFQTRSANERLLDARRKPDGWILRVQSDDPRVHSWPWEALRHQRDPQVLSVLAAVDRSLSPSLIEEPAPLPSELPQDRLRVLLISPRPLVDDVRYRAVNGAVMEVVQRDRLPVEITLVRPATYRALRETLEGNPPFHILHFDGHGGQTGRSGELLFEPESEGDPPRRVESSTLASLLRRHHVPVVVLTACQSSLFDATDGSPFASIATRLLQGQVRSVVAMAQVLHRDGAMCFAPDFYKELIKSGSVGNAVRAGRAAMDQERQREVRGGRISYNDAILPVVYQNQPLTLPLNAEAAQWRPVRRLSERVVAPERLYARDAELLQLERSLFRSEHVTVVLGLPRVGKTALVRDFVTWLEDTGHAAPIDWFDVAALGSASALINGMGQRLGQPFFQQTLTARLEQLQRAPGSRLCIWDGLDRVKWPDADLAALRTLVDGLRGRGMRLIATATELPAWLAGAHLEVLPLKHLHGDWASPR